MNVLKGIIAGLITFILTIICLCAFEEEITITTITGGLVFSLVICILGVFRSNNNQK